MTKCNIERLLDMCISSVALFLLLPFAVPIVLTLRFTGEGEIFFKQARIGKDGKEFNLLKFATMRKDSPILEGGSITTKNDPRVLPVGKFLRRSKINELPQLLNVLFGDLSLIGPRPLTPETFSYYSCDAKSSIITVLPGLSGIGSVVFRGEQDMIDDTSCSLSFYKDNIAPFKGALEEWYVRNKSFSIYILLIIITVWVVIFPSSKMVWRVFRGLPCPPDVLKKKVNYLN